MEREIVDAGRVTDPQRVPGYDNAVTPLPKVNTSAESLDKIEQIHATPDRKSGKGATHTVFRGGSTTVSPPKRYR